MLYKQKDVWEFLLLHFFPRVSRPQVQAPSQLSGWAEARGEPEDDITNDQTNQDSKNNNNSPARESQVWRNVGADYFIIMTVQSVSIIVLVNIYFSGPYCEIVFIVLYFLHLEQLVSGNNVPLNPEESVENIWW